MGKEDAGSAGLETVSAVLNVLELLATSPRGLRLTEIARTLDLSKPRAHRHLRALVERGYALQDAETERYEISVKLMVLGEAVRDRFGIVAVSRPEMLQLRERTGQAVTVATLIRGDVVVLELLQGGTVVEFGIRPGTKLPLDGSAHGSVTSAFMASTKGNAGAEKVRRQGWATAADQVLIGVNALAAPIFDHRGALAGTIAIVGSSQFIAAEPDAQQIRLVTDAAERISRQLGWSQPGRSQLERSRPERSRPERRTT